MWKTFKHLCFVTGMMYKWVKVSGKKVRTRVMIEIMKNGREEAREKCLRVVLCNKSLA